MKTKKPTPLVVAASRTCGKPARHGPPCGLDPDHVKRGERHSNGQFTWALRGKEQPKMKKKPTSTAERCLATASGGALKCALEGEHTVHSTLAKGRKAAQHATWTAGEDGAITVTTFARGKKQGAWTEAAPKSSAPPAKAPDARPAAQRCFCGGEDGKTKPHELGAPIVCRIPNHDMCMCDSGKERTHMIGAPGCEVQGRPPMLAAASTAMAAPAAKLPESVEDRVYAMIVAEPGRTAPEIGRRYSKAIAKLEADGRILWTNDGWWPSSVLAEFDREWNRLAEIGACDTPGGMEHVRVTEEWLRAGRPDEIEQFIRRRANAHPESVHLGYSGSLEHVPELDDDPAEPPEPDDDSDDPLEDEIRSDEERDFARKMREDREAHAREIEAAEAEAPAVEIAVRPASAAGPKILGYRRHPAAALFPMLEGEAFERFADRIQANGLRDPIVRVTVGGETFILDGSNRGAACEARGITPRFVDYEGPKDMASLVAYSIDKNGDGRRHLDPSVRAMIALEAATLGRGNPGNRETGGAAGLTQAEAGKRLGVGERLVRKAKVVRDKGTAKVKAAVMAGKLTVEAAEVVTKLPQAKQDEIADEALAKSGAIKSGRVRALVKQEEKRAIVRKINEQRVAPMPIGEFGVIYGDYPWLYDNSDQHDGSRGHMPYPPMSMDEIIAHARHAASRASKDCVLALWVTNAFVTKIDPVLAAYGAVHRSVFTWPKPRFVHGTWGRGQTEHLIIASIGQPTHTLNEISTLLPSWKPAHPGEHSSKPAEVSELLRRHCAGPFLELFGRDSTREGWTVWGAEVDKFATEAA